MQKHLFGLFAGLVGLVVLLSVPFWLGVAFGMLARGFRLGAGW